MNAIVFRQALLQTPGNRTNKCHIAWWNSMLLPILARGDVAYRCIDRHESVAEWIAQHQETTTQRYGVCHISHVLRTPSATSDNLFCTHFTTYDHSIWLLNGPGTAFQAEICALQSWHESIGLRWAELSMSAVRWHCWAKLQSFAATKTHKWNGTPIVKPVGTKQKMQRWRPSSVLIVYCQRKLHQPTFQLWNDGIAGIASKSLSPPATLSRPQATAD